MTKSIFETKEQYLAFRAAWKASVNDPRTKPTFTIDDSCYGGRYTAKVKHNGWLTADYHMLFNMLRGKPYYHGFSPITSPHKLSQHGTVINKGLCDAAYRVRCIIDEAKRIVAGRSNGKLEEVLAPFGGTITVQQLASLEAPNHIYIYANYGKGIKLAANIIARKVITYQDYQNLYEN